MGMGGPVPDPGRPDRNVIQGPDSSEASVLSGK